MHTNKQESNMEEEMNQNQCECGENNCQCEEHNCSKECSVRGYDILALIFCIYPIAISIFGIDYHSADVMVQTGVKMLSFLAFPLISAIISLKKSDKCRTHGSIVFTAVFILLVVYSVILLVGFTDGGKLF